MAVGTTMKDGTSHCKPSTTPFTSTGVSRACSPFSNTYDSVAHSGDSFATIIDFTMNNTHDSEKQIIHRDVKSSNILLTESFRAKVADFGFARTGDLDNDKTHVSTKVRGTVGYLDPEYMRTYQLTPKSDVYSFGVLLIEILTGRRPVELKRPPEERVTIRWAFKSYNEGRVMELVDPEMKETVNEEVLLKMLNLAIQCAAPTRNDRPDMKSVGEQLWVIRMDYMKSGRSR